MASRLADMIPPDNWPNNVVPVIDDSGLVHQMKPVKMEAGEALGYLFPDRGDDGLIAILENLAEFFEKKKNAPRRDKRPNSYEVDARVFARSVAAFFKSIYGLTPNEVIASCVALRFPDLESPPDEGNIRDWRGAR